jgi:pimeloyl-ACP methyl ester carboxylesterase
MSNPSEEPRLGRASANGLELAWAEWGDSAATPAKTIVGIHGITANLFSWGALAPDLAARGFRFIAYDLRGRGDSSKPYTGYNTVLHAQDLLNLLDFFRLPSANLVGHSLGAVIALQFAASYPERARKLVLVDHGMDTPADARQTIGSSFSRLTRIFSSREEHLNFFKASPVYPAWTEAVERFVGYDGQVQPDGTVKTKVLPEAAEEDLTSQYIPEYLPSRLYTSIKLPTLIMRATVGTLDGGRSGFILSEENAHLLNQKIAGSKLVEIPGVNHYTIALDPTPQVLQEIVVFLE